MSAQRFSDQLLAKAEPVWRRTLDHPFVRGLGDGTLSLDRFRFYLCQDYVFLIEYCRVLALAVAKSRDLAAMQFFSGLLHDTLHKEMALQRDFSERLGLSNAELEGTVAAPVTVAYSRHLLAVAYGGGVADILAAIMPCQWGYCEIGRALKGRGEPPVEFYAEWIRMYSSPEFAALAERLRRMFDDLTAELPAAEREPLEQHFLTSARFEHSFWEMAYNRAQWPV